MVNLRKFIIKLFKDLRGEIISPSPTTGPTTNPTEDPTPLQIRN